MVLPNSQQSSSSAEFKPQSQPFTTTKKYQSYAKAVKSSTKISLLHDDFQHSDQDEENQISTLQSRKYRSSRTPNALLFDISSVRQQYADQAAMVIVAEQHPNVYACVPLSDGTKRYLEVYAEAEKDKALLMEQGLLFPKSKLRIFPCRAINDFSKIVNLKLSRLPLLPAKDVLEGLKKSLQPFGTILDVGILTNSVTKHFMGLGYAILDTNSSSLSEIKENQESNNASINPLTHVINWCETEDSFLATWNNMPTWCRYCHKEGHTKFECADSKANLICYNCHQNGHRSFECPRKAQTSSMSNKKPRKTPKESLVNENNNNEISTIDHSAETMKSKYATKDTILSMQFPIEGEDKDPSYNPNEENMSDDMSEISYGNESEDHDVHMSTEQLGSNTEEHQFPQNSSEDAQGEQINHLNDLPTNNSNLITSHDKINTTNSMTPNTNTSNINHMNNPGYTTIFQPNSLGNPSSLNEVGKQ